MNSVELVRQTRGGCHQTNDLKNKYLYAHCSVLILGKIAASCAIFKAKMQKIRFPPAALGLHPLLRWGSLALTRIPNGIAYLEGNGGEGAAKGRDKEGEDRVSGKSGEGTR